VSGLTLAPAAREDLRDIADYIASDSPPSAHRVPDAIFLAFDRLAEQPGAGLRSGPGHFSRVEMR
jgi:plasmid stabilization system protein ParE